MMHVLHHRRIELAMRGVEHGTGRLSAVERRRIERDIEQLLAAVNRAQGVLQMNAVLRRRRAQRKAGTR